MVVLVAPVGSRMSDRARGDVNLSWARWTGQTGQGQPFLPQPSLLSNDL